MTTKDASKLTDFYLRQFTGSENWYRHPLARQVLFTDGAKHVADHGGAYWLLDEIALNQKYVPALARTRFQVWRLAVDTAKATGTLTCEDGNGEAVFRKQLEFTDFPLTEITLWFTDNTILLPSEY